VNYFKSLIDKQWGSHCHRFQRRVLSQIEISR